MTRSRVVRMVLISLVILGLGLIASPAVEPAPAMGGQFVRSLQRPPFLSTVRAQDGPEQLDIGEYLDEEAGIAAWCQTPVAIDLSRVQDQCQVIEIETQDYLICSVSVPGYALDEWDTHVYVHTDGWIVAYYMNTDVTGRIVDLLGKTIDSTLVENMVETMAGEAGTGCSAASLYDFRHPDATNMLFVAEDDGADGSTYTINTPASYDYMDRAWAKYNQYGTCTYTIDGAQPTAIVNVSVFCIGPVTYAQLVPGTTHTVNVNANGSDYGVLMLTYAVP